MNISNLTAFPVYLYKVGAFVYSPEEVLMVPGGENPVVQVEKGRWHSLECLEPKTVLFESKDGKYEPLAEEDIMK